MAGNQNSGRKPRDAPWPTERVCRSCSKLLPMTGYAKEPRRRKLKGGGLGFPSWPLSCITCTLAQTRESNRVSKRTRLTVCQAKRHYLDSWKVRPCNRCGLRYDAACMDFDHLPGFSKVAAVSHMMGTRWTLVALKAEVAKCQLLCSNCHRVVTANRRIQADRVERNLRRVNRGLVRTAKRKPCADCRKRHPPESMDLVHQEGKLKRWSIGQMYALSTESILAEMAKCDLVCSNCNRIRKHISLSNVSSRV